MTSVLQRQPAATPLGFRALAESAPPADAEVRGRGMPAELEQRYGGQLEVPLRPEGPTVVANFVSTLDGVVAFGQGDLSGGGLVSGFHEPDRFVMGLLRALADVVVVGAGTLRGSTDHRWTPQHVHPASADLFAEWRGAMNLAPQPTTLIVTASGDLPTGHAGLHDPNVPVVIATTATGAAQLARMGNLGDHVTIELVGSGDGVSPQDLIALASRHGRLVLTEGGPHVMGDLVREDGLDELFLTIAPQLAGRGSGERLGLVEGIALAPDEARWHDLVSVRQSGSHVFLRYRRRNPATNYEG